MKTDIWSAGIGLYAMIAAHFLWIVPDDLPPDILMKETAKQIAEGDISLPDGISDQLQNLLGNMLNVDPEERPTADEILQHPWFADLNDPEEYDERPNNDIVNLVENLLHDLDMRRENAKKGK